MLGDGAKDVCPSSSGHIVFYTDAADAKADLEELKAQRSEEAASKLGLDHTPLGRAFALTQGLMGLNAPAQCRLQFSRAVAASEGQAGVPQELRERMGKAGPFPLFYSERIDSHDVTPVFFHREDLNAFWVASGQSADDLPTPTVTDLRVVVARTLQEPGFWNPLTYVPPKASEPTVAELKARAQRDGTVADGFARGARVMKQVAEGVATADGEMPPALVEAS